MFLNSLRHGARRGFEILGSLQTLDEGEGPGYTPQPRSKSAARISLSWTLVACIPRQSYCESRSLELAASHLYGTLVGLHYFPHDEKAQSESARWLRCSCITFVDERFENQRLLVCGDRGAPIRNRPNHVGSRGAHRDVGLLVGRM